MFNLELNTQTLIYIIGVLSVIFVLLIIWTARLEIRINKLLRGKNAESLESSIFNLGEEINSLQSFQEDMKKYLTDVERRLRRSAQGISTVRFNPFKGTGAGGDQSFATAILDEEGSGVVLSSLYTRDRVSMYAKPVVNFKSKYRLSYEEKEAIKNATVT